MKHTTFTRQPQQRDCLNPLRFQSLMVQLPSEKRNERIVERSSDTGLALEGTFIHCGTGQPGRKVAYRLPGPITLYFVASDKANLADWHYVLMWDKRQGRYCCSCYEGRNCGGCKHEAEVEEYTTIIA